VIAIDSDMNPVLYQRSMVIHAFDYIKAYNIAYESNI